MAKPLTSVLAFVQLLLSRGWGVLQAAFAALAGLLSFLWSNIQFIALGFALLLFGALWALGNDTIPEALEFLWRCGVFPLLELPFSLLGPLVEIYEWLICWWNALGLFNRLVSLRLVTQLLRACPNEFSYVALFTYLIGAARALAVYVFRWLIEGLRASNMPIYPLALELTTALSFLGFLLECLCANLRILGDFLVRLFASHWLACALHQLVNSLVYFLQVIIAWLFSLLIALAFIIGGGATTLAALRDAVLDNTGPYAPPPPFGVTERLAAASFYAAEFGNHLIATAVCTIVAEVETGGFDTVASDAAFTACLTPPGSAERNATCAAWLAVDPDANVTLCLTRVNLRVNWLGWAGALVNAAVRAYGAFIHLAINAGRVAREFFTLPPGPRFAADEWQLDSVWDTLRAPLPALGPSALLANNTILFGNASALWNATCNATNTTHDAIPCAECPDLALRSFEEHWCELWVGVDDLLEPVFGLRLLDPLLCCLVGRGVRVAVAGAKFVADLARHFLAGVDRFVVQLLNRDAWDAPFTELAGRPTALGGLIACVCDLIDAIDRERLHCVCVVLVHAAKVLVEAVRALALLVPALGNTAASLNGSPLYQPQFPGIVDILCLARSPFCLDLEGHFFKWLRVPRDRATLFVFVNVTTNAGTFNGTFPEYSYLPLSNGTNTTLLCSNSSTVQLVVVNGTLVYVFDAATNTTLFAVLADALAPTNDTVAIGAPGTVVVPANATAGPVNGTLFYTYAAYGNGTVCVSVFVAAGDALLECLCQILSVEFINAFLTTPVNASEIPDFCCAPRFFGRLLVEAAKFLLGGILGLVEMIVNLLTATGDATVVLEWAACTDATDAGCSPIPEMLSDLQDLLLCPCAIIDKITIGGQPIPCLCEFIDSLVLGAMELLRTVLTFAGAIVFTADCAADVPAFPAPNCTVLLLERYVRAFDHVDLALEFFGDAFGQLGCVLGFAFGGGRCLDQPSGATCGPAGTVVFADISGCTGPVPDGGDPVDGYPDWSSNACECSPLYRFERLFKRVFDALALIVTVPLDVALDFIQLLQDITTPDTTSIVTDIGGFFTAVIKLVLDEVGFALFGNPCALETAPTTACPVLPDPQDAFGIVQQLGFVVNCVFGPANCASSPPCFGEILVVIGNALRTIYFCIASLLLRPVNIIIAIVAADTTAFVDNVVGILEDLLCLIGAIPNLVGQLLAVILGLFAAIIDVIVPGLGTFIADLLAPILGLINDIAGFLDFLFDLPGYPKRATTGLAFSPALALLVHSPAEFARTMVQDSLCRRALVAYGADFAENPGALAPEQLLVHHFCFAAAALPPLVNSALAARGGELAALHVPDDLFTNSTQLLTTVQEAIDLGLLLFDWTRAARAEGRLSAAGLYSYVDLWADDLDTLLLLGDDDDPLRRTHIGHTTAFPHLYAANLTALHVKPVRHSTTFAAFAAARGHGAHPLLGAIARLQTWTRQQQLERAATQWNSVVIDALRGLPLAPLRRAVDSFKRGIRGARDASWARVTDGLVSPAAPAVAAAPARTLPALAAEVAAGMARHVRARVAAAYAPERLEDALLAWHARFAHRGAVERGLAATLRTLARVAQATGGTELTAGLHGAVRGLERHVERLRAERASRLVVQPDGTVAVAKRCTNCVFPAPPLAPPAPCDPAVDDCFDCAIVELLANETVAIFDLCYQRLIGNGTAIISAPTNDLGLLALPAPGERTGVALVDMLLAALEQLLGFDLIGSILAFLTTTNMDPDAGPIGLLAFIPIVSRCDRELHLQCRFGFGVPIGLLAALIATIAVPLALYTFFPCGAGLWSIVVNFVTIWGLFLIVFAYVAWGYNPNCIMTPQNTLSSLLLPISIPLPLLPECAARQLRDFVKMFLVECLYTIFPAWLQAGIVPGTPLCPVCPDRIDLNDCRDDAFNFDDAGDLLSYLLAQIVPSISSFLSTTCLVRGGCFFGLGVVPGENSGLLAGLIGAPPVANVTTNVTAAALHECAARSAPLALGYIGIAVLAAVAAVYFAPLIGAVLLFLWDLWRWLWAALTGRRPEDPESVDAPKEYAPRPVFYLPPGAGRGADAGPDMPIGAPLGGGAAAGARAVFAWDAARGAFAPLGWMHGAPPQQQ